MRRFFRRRSIRAADILNLKITYANHLLDAGIDSSWKDAERGDAIWRLLAVRGGAFWAPMMARLANDPATLALIDSPARDGITALHIARSALNTAQAKALLNAGASPVLQDSAGKSPLHCAGHKFGSKAMGKRVPLEGLAILLKARPDDILGGSRESRSTQANLAGRGGRAISIFEEAILGAEEQAVGLARKASRRRL